MKKLFMIILFGIHLIGISQNIQYDIQRQKDSLYLISKEYNERVSYACMLMDTILYADYDAIIKILPKDKEWIKEKKKIYNQLQELDNYSDKLVSNDTTILLNRDIKDPQIRILNISFRFLNPLNEDQRESYLFNYKFYDKESELKLFDIDINKSLVDKEEYNRIENLIENAILPEIND